MNGRHEDGFNTQGEPSRLIKRTAGLLNEAMAVAAAFTMRKRGAVP